MTYVGRVFLEVKNCDVFNRIQHTYFDNHR